MTTFAGGTGGGDVDGPVATSRFNQPQGISAADDGTLYVSDLGNSSVRKVSVGGVVTTLARGLELPLRTAARSAAGPVYVLLGAVGGFGRYSKVISQDGAVRPFVYTGSSFTPAALATDNAGNMYLSQSGGVVLISPTENYRTFATGMDASGLHVDAAGTIYFIAGSSAGVIDSAGKVTIRAARAIEGGLLEAGLAVDPDGNMYVTDGANIRKVTPQGAVATIANITTVQGVPAGFDANVLTKMNGLTWSGGALYATVLNAVIRISL
ncbi:MAG: hypothetical protein ABIR26_12680 [Ramlibacter sp.]